MYTIDYQNSFLDNSLQKGLKLASIFKCKTQYYHGGKALRWYCYKEIKRNKEKQKPF